MELHLRMLSLAKIPTGKRVLISSIENSHITTKLLELGFIVGTEVEVIFAAPLRDPIAVELNGAIISLRLDEASLINVENTINI